MSENKIIRIAQIVGSMNSGGVESMVMNYYRHIDRTKIQFDFIVLEGSTHIPDQEIKSLGGRIFIVPSYKHIFAYRKALNKLFTENHYDIVHSHVNSLSVFPLSVAKKAGVKVRIAHSHSTTNKKEHLRNFIKNILRLFSKKYATHYFACSELAGRWLFGDKTFDKGLVTIINNAIDLEKFAFNEQTRDIIRAEYGLKDKFVIGHIGRFMSQKNHELLLEAFADVKKERQEAVLLLLGDGPLFEDMKNKAKELGVADSVVFAGVKDNANEYYSAMDLFVLPSLYEGLGMVLIEAQANGLKSLASASVPKAAMVIPKGIDFLPLEKDSWVRSICEFNSDDIDRRSGYMNMKNSIYDINSEAEK